MSNPTEASIAHIAVAVKNLDEAATQLEKVLNVRLSHRERVDDQKVELRFGEIGGVRFEFLEPTAADSPISKFIDKRGGGIHHVALYVENLDAKLKELKAKGVPLIDEVPRIGAEGCRIAFLHPKAVAGILVELIEK